MSIFHNIADAISDTAFIWRQEMRQVLQDRILESYQQALLEMPPQTEGQETAE